MRPMLTVFHLPERIIVRADDVEDLWRAAQFRMLLAADDIPREEGIGVVSCLAASVKILSAGALASRKPPYDSYPGGAEQYQFFVG